MWIYFFDILFAAPVCAHVGACTSPESTGNALMTNKLLGSNDPGARVFGIDPGKSDDAECKGSPVTVWSPKSDTTTAKSDTTTAKSDTTTAKSDTTTAKSNTTTAKSVVDDACGTVLGVAGATLSFVATAIMN